MLVGLALEQPPLLALALAQVLALAMGESLESA
jgi:hypothetical protein